MVRLFISLSPPLIPILLLVPILQGSRVHISDGDTIRLDGERIRLACIDAPEADQPWGSQSTARLRELIGAGSQLHVQVLDTDRYGRRVAKLWVGEVYIQEALVREGLAWVYPQFLHRCSTTAERLTQAQEEAVLFDRGLWAVEDPIPPWQWRRRR